jgi:hypothetical protein
MIQTSCRIMTNVIECNNIHFHCTKYYVHYISFTGITRLYDLWEGLYDLGRVLYVLS